MNRNTDVQYDRAFPMELVMVPAIVGTLVWMCVLVSGFGF